MRAKEHGIGVDEVVSMEVTKLGVNGTPTLLLLDDQSKLEEMWVGKLNESQEEQVLARLKKACAGYALPKAAMRLPAAPAAAPKGYGRS